MKEKKKTSQKVTERSAESPKIENRQPERRNIVTKLDSRIIRAIGDFYHGRNKTRKVDHAHKRKEQPN